MKYLIGISGPPRSGKDTLGDAIAAAVTARYSRPPAVVALSMQMRLAVYAMLGRPYSLSDYEQQKDVSQNMFLGRTIRQEMIELSERHVKPRLGKGFWARSGINAFEASGASLMIVTDMGFEEEVSEMVAYFGRDQCMWINLKRPGTSFANDSRGYVGRPQSTVAFDNPGIGLEFFIAAARETLAYAAAWGWELSG